MIAPSKEALGILLRVGVYALLAIVGLILFPAVLYPIGGYFTAAVFGVFAAASVANAMALRIFDRLRLPAIGLNWTAGSGRNLVARSRRRR